MAERVVVGMSGGVDSSVAALLLKREGYEVVGLFMKNWEDDDDDEYCSTRQDLIDAAAAADAIGIELEAVNFAAEYKDRVFAEFLREYSAGRTPNPDVLCNAEIKFRAFLDHAMRLGAAKIATGHYARIRAGEGGVELLRGADRNKDQSYFLHRLNQAQLSRVLFPVGQLRKPEVRRLALRSRSAEPRQEGLDRDLLHRRAPVPRIPQPLPAEEAGPVVTPEGRRMGEHIGLAFYTIGQRKGIGLGGAKGGSGEAWYVAAKDVAANTLTVVQGHDHPLLLRASLDALDASWVAGAAPRQGSRHGAKTRYRQADAACTLSRVAGGRDLGGVRRAAVGGDPGAVGRALRRRGLPGRRDHRLGGPA